MLLGFQLYCKHKYTLLAFQCSSNAGCKSGSQRGFIFDKNAIPKGGREYHIPSKPIEQTPFPQPPIYLLLPLEPSVSSGWS